MNQTSCFYIVLRAIVRALLAILFPMRVTGLSNVPSAGAVLIVSNHISLLDPVFILCALKRPIHFMAKAELFRSRFLGGLLRRMGAFPVSRGNSDMAAIRASMGVLSGGGVLGIYPQGHRYHHDEVHKMQNGAALLALRSQATVVPVHMQAPLRLFRRTHIDIGPAIDLSDLTRVSSDTMAEATARMSAAIWREKIEGGKENA